MIKPELAFHVRVPAGEEQHHPQLAQARISHSLHPAAV
jgi:hypothetical protein